MPANLVLQMLKISWHTIDRVDLATKFKLNLVKNSYLVFALRVTLMHETDSISNLF